MNFFSIYMDSRIINSKRLQAILLHDECSSLWWWARPIRFFMHATLNHNTFGIWNHVILLQPKILSLRKFFIKKNNTSTIKGRNEWSKSIEYKMHYSIENSWKMRLSMTMTIILLKNYINHILDLTWQFKFLN